MIKRLLYIVLLLLIPALASASPKTLASWDTPTGCYITSPNLSGQTSQSSSGVTLSTEGTSDWAHWGLTDASSFNHKSGVTQQISNYTLLGSTNPSRYTDSSVAFSWSGGTPTAGASNSTTGIYFNSIGNGYRLTIPAQSSRQTLTIYLGVWNARGSIAARLSDDSVSSYTGSVDNSSDSSNDVVVLSFASTTIGVNLIVEYTMADNYGNSGANISLQAATLAPAAPLDNCDAITGYKLYAGTSHGVYTVSTSVSVTNAALLSQVTGTLPRGYICIVATALTAYSESLYSNEICFWNLGNYAYSDNSTRPVPKKPTVPGTPVDVADNFNRNDISPIAGNWTTVPGAGAMQISSSRLQGIGTSNTIYWNANVFSNTQCSRATMLDTGATYGGPAVRVSTTLHSYYYFKVANTGTSYEYGKVVNGTWTQLGANVSGTPHAGDVLTICASGSTLTGYVDEAVNATRTDTDLPSGRAGVGIYGTVTHLDNWQGWDGGYK